MILLCFFLCEPEGYYTNPDLFATPEVGYSGLEDYMLTV